MEIPFVGPSYQLRGLSADSQRTVNMYLCINETQNGKSNAFLQHTPGLKPFRNLKKANDDVKIRAIYVDSYDNLYAISGYNFIKIIQSGDTFIEKVVGVIDTTVGNVSLADNGKEIGIVDGINYYVYDIETEVFGKYNHLDGWLGSDTITYYNSYFIFIQRDSRQFFISRPFDGKTLNALDVAVSENSLGNLINSISYNQTVWLFSRKNIAVYVNTGAADFPINPLNGGGFIEVGCISKNSIQICNNQVIWLGSDNNGYGNIYISTGGLPEKISTYAVDFAIQSYDSIEDANAYSYQQDGNYFYCINFKNAGTTWCYDLTTKSWHERRYLNPMTGDFERHLAENHVLYKNKHIVYDYRNNNLYELRSDYYKDNGDTITRMRTSPHLFGTDLEKRTHKSFYLDLDVGDYEIDNEIFIFIEHSGNGGKTWSNKLKCSLGKKGNYLSRGYWKNLGFARNKTYRISYSHPTKCIWLSAKVDTDPSYRDKDKEGGG